MQSPSVKTMVIIQMRCEGLHGRFMSLCVVRRWIKKFLPCAVRADKLIPSGNRFGFRPAGWLHMPP